MTKQEIAAVFEEIGTLLDPEASMSFGMPALTAPGRSVRGVVARLVRGAGVCATCGIAAISPFDENRNAIQKHDTWPDDRTKKEWLHE